jgi:large subunit ribosomal protein L21
MQAVIKAGSSQYLVSEGQEILVDKIAGTDTSVKFNDILLFVDGKQTLVGSPFLEGYSVEAQVMGQEKGDKVRVFKFKAKSRYRKTTGFRAQLTRLKIVSIMSPNSPKVEKAVEEKPKTKAVKKTSQTRSKKS